MFEVVVVVRELFFASVTCALHLPPAWAAEFSGFEVEHSINPKP